MTVPILWRTKRQRYSLQSEVCSSCEQVVFPPRELCPYCHSEMDDGLLNVAHQRESYSCGFPFVMPKAELVQAVGDD